MTVLAFGDIIVDGKSAFTSVCTLDDTRIKIRFAGSIRVENPSQHLQSYLNELRALLSATEFDSAELDFRELRFCNSNGFYVVMDISELVLEANESSVDVHRLIDDDWHQETLPILLNVDEPRMQSRIRFIEHEST